MKPDSAGCAGPVVRRRADGSIDYDVYVARARELRAAEVSRLIRAVVARLLRPAL
jgi:hypothetical protein